MIKKETCHHVIIIYFHELYISTNGVNNLSFDNDDMKPSKRQVTFLSLVSGLNHNINKQNLAKFGFPLSLQKLIKGSLTPKERTPPVPA